MDIGTGDGRFVVDQARANPQKFCIGIDATADAMRASSQKTIVKAQRGGVSNALFVWAGVETLPLDLTNTATEITINYPWGSLLRALVEPDINILRGIFQLARPGAQLTLLINISAFENADYRLKLRLPELTLESAKNRLVPAYQNLGLTKLRIAIMDKNIPHITTWGQKLTQGSGSRRTLLIDGIII